VLFAVPWYRCGLCVALMVLMAAYTTSAESDGSQPGSQLGSQPGTQSGAHPGPIQFTNVTAAAGIKFVNYRGNEGIAINREIFGPGVCVADFDGDGLQDIYFVNGRDLYHHGINVRNALYHNNGTGPSPT